MQKFGARNIFQILQRIDQFIQIMSVNGSEISQFQGFKQIAAFIYKTLDAVFDFTGNLPAEMSADWQFAQGPSRYRP